MAKGRSLQDLIRSRQQSGFVGRQQQVVQYQENLGLAVDDERRRFLFNIHGDAGVGKTYLTRQLLQSAIDYGCLTAYVDETIDDVASAMICMAKEFSRGGARLGEFEKRAAAYRERRHELEADPHAPESVSAFLTRTAVTIGLAAARDVPLAGSLLAPVDAAAAADQVNRARTYLARKFSNHADLRLLLSPAEELTPLFVSDMDCAAAGRPVALFIDTYERSAPLLDRWLRRLYDGQYGDLPGTLITTISGQKPLDPNLWSDYLPVIADVPLEPFSDAEARQFLASKNIHDESLVQVILTLSGCLPMWLATLAAARPADAADIGDPAGDAVERFLRWEDDPARRSLAMTAALPRLLNQDIVAAIAPADEAGELFSWLCGLPFVDRQAGSWAYHEVVRAAMLRLQLAQAPTEWRSNQAALARANRRWTRAAVSRTENAWTDPGWIDHAAEEIYHLLCAAPVKNLPRALTSAVRAGEHSIQHARQWAHLIADAGRDTGNQSLSDWGRRLRDGIHDNDLTCYFTHLIIDADFGDETLILALEQRARCHRLARRYDQALTDLDHALELDPTVAWIMVERGQVFQLMGRYDEALADLNRAIELDPDQVRILAERGETRRLAERYDEALADLNHAIEIDPGYSRAIGRRGRTYQVTGRYDEALADYDRAIELDPQYVWAIGSRGQTYQAMERYGEALADCHRAIELDPTQMWIMIERGETYRLMGHDDEALADFNRAIESGLADAEVIGSRGQAYQALERYGEALADYNRAIELDPSMAWVLAERGRTYRVLERYDEALADFNHAIELDSTDAWVTGKRGQTYRAMGRYDEALADFNRAIELDSSQAWIAAERGRTYQAMERYDEALADFNRAIEADPTDAQAIEDRSQVCQAMGRCGEALAGSSRALEPGPTTGFRKE